jgi:hypothetical protein
MNFWRILDFRCCVDNIFVLLWYYVVYVGNCMRLFREGLSVPLSRVKQSNKNNTNFNDVKKSSNTLLELSYFIKDKLVGYLINN